MDLLSYGISQPKQPITSRFIDAMILNEPLKVLQFTEPQRIETWKLLNDQLFARRPDIKARIYDHRGTQCDLSFCRVLTNVRHFCVDGICGSVDNIECIADMPHLESLDIGISGLDSFEFLKDVSPNLKRLSLEHTRSKKPRLGVLSRFRELETIYLEGQQKDIEVLSQLTNLIDVTLHSITTPNLNYLQPLSNMWSLDIKLGGIRDLTAIAGMDGVKYLELWLIRGLER